MRPARHPTEPSGDGSAHQDHSAHNLRLEKNKMDLIIDIRWREFLTKWAAALLQILVSAAFIMWALTPTSHPLGYWTIATYLFVGAVAYSAITLPARITDRSASE